jgi:hypothetical protein
MPRLIFEHHADASGTRRCCIVERLPQEHFTPLEPMWIEIRGLNMPEPAVWDGFLFGILLRLMQIGQPVRIDGPISRQALRHVIELQDCWALWLPEDYHRVSLEPASVVDLSPETGKPVICAYSGGVDGTFSLLRHRLRWLGEAALPVEFALMVQGFDVDLDDTQSFDRLVRRCQPLLSQIGAQLHVVRTNLKVASQQDWLNSFAAQLSACLHQFAGACSGGIIGSSEPYNALVLPLGSTPITDPLLSGGAFSIYHDGAGYSRTAKLERIRDHELALSTLKVCWEGPNPDENCGTCEKCVRTRLNLLAAGVPNPPCFPGTLDLRAISTIQCKAHAQYAELLSILRYCRQHGIEAKWVDVLRARLERYPREVRIRACKERVRRFLGDTHPAWRAARWIKRSLQARTAARHPRRTSAVAN